MDSFRGHFSSHDEPGTDSSGPEDSAPSPTPEASVTDERRLQVRAYNFWASLLGNRTFPDIARLHPEELPDFGPYSVLLDFTDGIEHPRIAHLGANLAAECKTPHAILSLDEVPPRSLLSRITDHYMQILANQAPIGFEAEFVNQAGRTVLYRGILLPFSRDDARIDYIFGVINWKELADQSSTDALMRQVDEAVDALPATLSVAVRDAAPMSGWADGPADPASAAIDGPLDAGPMTLELPLGDFGPADARIVERVHITHAEDLSLGDWLVIAREEALNARGCEDRSHQALYEALGRTFDFSLAAARAPQDFAGLVADAGLRLQQRAPLVALVKLVFGADYDKTRLTEYATVIGHGRRLGLAHGELGPLLATFPGGIKALVREERQLRRAEQGRIAAAPLDRAALVGKLRQLEGCALDAVACDSEFAVLLARRLDSGEVVLLGEVHGDPALFERAARKLLG